MLFGDPVPERVRSVDLVAVLATVTIGAVAVADVLHVNGRDRATELAMLRATGWSDAAVVRLITYEGLGIGVIGAVAGASAGLCGAAEVGGGITGRLPLTAVASAFAGFVVVGLAAVVPALRHPGTPMSELLAEE
jgi:ABC-type antimicrobial peptide transport system permease subunit